MDGHSVEAKPRKTIPTSGMDGWFAGEAKKSYDWAGFPGAAGGAAEEVHECCAASALRRFA
jgi:hypothetical protein